MRASNKKGKGKTALRKKKSAKSQIRQAQPSDFESIMEIENACFPGELAYSREQIKYLLFKANGTSLVEEFDGEIRGYVTALFRRNSSIGYIETIGVAPPCQGSGVGKRLLLAAEELMVNRGATSSRLEVSTGNRPAISMYERIGYKITVTVPEYFIYKHNGTRSAYRMHKDLFSR